MQLIEVPAAFAAATREREGAWGEAWLNELPHLVRTLCREWRLLEDGPVMHGYLALVVPVARGGASKSWSMRVPPCGHRS